MNAATTEEKAPFVVVVGVKAQTKRHHAKELQEEDERRNNAFAPRSSIQRPLFKKKNNTIPAPLRAGGRWARGECSRMLFGPANHYDVLEWLTGCMEEQRQRLQRKYGFDLTLADEGVYAVVPHQP